MLSHYMPVAHEVVDKYERAPGVRNVDVLDLPPEPAYDLIVSVSTLEHVGRDERPREPERAVQRARAPARGSCGPGGELFATVPVGYNPDARRRARGRPPRRCGRCAARPGVRSIPPRRWSVRTTSSSTGPARSCSSRPTPYADPMHILVLTDRDWTHPQGGGTGTNLFGQISRWLAWGHRVTVVACSYPGAEPRSGSAT